MKFGRYTTVLTEVRDKILIISLNRPEKKNSFNGVLVKELLEIVHKSKVKNEITAIILTGIGDTFCAGADLGYLESLLIKDYQAHLEDSRKLKDLYYTIFSFPKPTLALVNGAALAGGCGLVTVCDFAFAVPEAIFGYPEVKIGFVAAIVSVFLLQNIGYRRAKNLLLTGKTIDAVIAKDIGLIDELVGEGSLLDYGLNFLNTLRKNSPASMYLSKEIVNRNAWADIDQILEEACVYNARTRQEKDFKEGIRAFLEKRAPNWSYYPIPKL